MKPLFPGDIIELLKKVDFVPAVRLGNSHLEFMEWNEESYADTLEKMIHAVTTMSNAGGGTIVYGVKDDTIGSDKAITGIPEGIELSEIQSLIYKTTSPPLKIFIEQFEYLDKKLFLINVPKSSSNGSGKNGNKGVSIDKEFKSILSGMLRTSSFIKNKTEEQPERKIIEHSIITERTPAPVTYNASDYTATLIKRDWRDIVSQASLEALRNELKRQRIPEDLLNMSDEELLKELDFTQGELLTFGGLLVIGTAEAISRYIPQHEWSYRRLASDTELLASEDGNNNILFSAPRLTELINVDNPILTVKNRLFHHEYPVYNIEALREAIMNAFCHRDYSIPGQVMVKQYKNRIEISNPGHFVGGINTKNILHHDPVARNITLAKILQKIRLVNRSNLGVPRIFKSFLIEGKDPPKYYDYNGLIKLVLFGRQNKKYVNVITRLEEEGHEISVDHLLIIQHLIQHRKITLKKAQEICYQRPVEIIQEIFEDLERWKVFESI
jgi:ATP-dependent DNA helicase RecG